MQTHADRECSVDPRTLDFEVQWTPEKRAGWVARIEAARVPLADAVEAYRPLEAALTVAESGMRASVRSAHSKLTAFKRDLKSLGLTETQIHEIIPDRSKRGSGGGGGGGGEDV